MKAYADLVKTIMRTGEKRENRTGIDTLSTFGHMFTHDLQEGFPLLTTKKMNLSLIAGELRWFLDANTKPSELNSKIWDEWSHNDNIGPMYGSIWREYDCGDGTYLDQIDELVYNLKNKPNSRRHILTTLHLGSVPDETDSPQENVANGKGALWPCHGLVTQFNVRSDKYLDLIMFQRSADTALGVPYNIASYALLCHIIANETDLLVGELKIVFGDLHVYENHLESLADQISRDPQPLPRLQGNPKLDFKIEDIKLDRYDPAPAVRYEIAV